MTNRLFKSSMFFFLALVGLVGLYLFLAPQSASAQYIENNLVDDTIFLDAASMSQAQIQSFLEARGSYLSTYSSYSGRDNTNVLASRIIYEAAQDYGMNPKVILATLQKEQSLVTATNPSASQLQKAMGYGCPDSASCDAKYYGLFNQVDNGAWQFRKNFERARGNNAWWSTSPGYACSGATRYYSTGLYAGRNVTFYDDNSTAIKTFTLNNASTASLYCYTPHPYNNPNGLYGNPAYGTVGQYYSGSYNFVLWFERWFGSTQPAVVISSPIRVFAVEQGVFSGTPVQTSFNITNNTDSAINIGSMAVTVRDSNGGNFDYQLKQMTIPARATATYSDTRVFPAEGTYTFGLTNFSNGTWNDGYPVSNNIDNPRTATYVLKAMPTITTEPALNVSDMRVGKSANVTFTVKNNSASAFDAGKVALALRSPTGANVDLPLVSTGTIAAGGTFTYSRPFTPAQVGTYTGYITATTNNGVTWNEVNYPAQASGVSRTLSFGVKDSPTLTQGPAVSVVSPRVGQQVVSSFKVRNFGDATVNAGYIGLAIRDPYGRNVDAGGTTVSINADSEYTFQANTTFQTPGVYTAWITSYRNGIWDDNGYPVAESGSVVRRITFTVLPNPTLTGSLTSSVESPAINQQFTMSFKVKNFGSSSIDLGYIGVGGRTTTSQNVDLGTQHVILGAGEEKTLSFSAMATASGTVRYFVLGTPDFNTWNDGPVVDSGSIAKTLNVTIHN